MDIILEIAKASDVRTFAHILTLNKETRNYSAMYYRHVKSVFNTTFNNVIDEFRKTYMYVTDSQLRYVESLRSLNKVMEHERSHDLLHDVMRHCVSKTPMGVTEQDINIVFSKVLNNENLSDNESSIWTVFETYLFGESFVLRVKITVDDGNEFDIDVDLMSKTISLNVMNTFTGEKLVECVEFAIDNVDGLYDEIINHSGFDFMLRKLSTAVYFEKRYTGYYPYTWLIEQSTSHQVLEVIDEVYGECTDKLLFWDAENYVASCLDIV